MTEELFESWGIEEFLMPFAQRHVRFKIPSPLGQGGTSGGLGNGSQPTPALCATPPQEGIFKGKSGKERPKQDVVQEQLIPTRPSQFPAPFLSTRSSERQDCS
jgi:hypothetical protein